MNSNELRIGNWVLYEGKPTKVDEIFIGAFKHLKAEPIELTAEVLERAGFERDDKGHPFNPQDFLRKRIGKISFESDNSDDFKTVFVYVRGHDICSTTKLHELQNLFYALTGEEINITLC
jgi:hypothetical protein